MKLAAHELHDLHELTLSCVNTITNMAYMMNHVQDSDLKSIMERHFPLHVRDYNMKVEFLNDSQGALKELPLLRENGQLGNYTQSTAGQYPPVQPRTQMQDMSDREMATSYLLTLKRAGREYAWSAMEAANPELRSFFQTAFMMSCSHAYDVWQFMVNKGFYPLEPADSQMTATIASVYQVIPESQQQIQSYLSQHQNPIEGRSNQLYQ